MQSAHPDNLVNGEVVVQNGELILGAPHGRPIRRTVVE
jgi:hypothetical protein